MISPLTVMTPDSISASASLREQTPALAMNRLSRIGPPAMPKGFLAGAGPRRTGRPLPPCWSGRKSFRLLDERLEWGFPVGLGRDPERPEEAGFFMPLRYRIMAGKRMHPQCVRCVEHFGHIRCIGCRNECAPHQSHDDAKKYERRV